MPSDSENEVFNYTTSYAFDVANAMPFLGNNDAYRISYAAYMKRAVQSDPQTDQLLQDQTQYFFLQYKGNETGN